MLLRLRIENLALIGHAELELAPGLNVLTGETGAGKTMLAQAIGLVAGAAPVQGMVGPHGQEAYVEAEFEIGEELWGDEALATAAALRPEGEETLLVARRISATGRSRALLWGRGCARSDLELIGERLLEVSSQHEARRVGRPTTQVALLDAAAGNGELVRAMNDAWVGLRHAHRELDGALRQALDAERRRGELEELTARMEAVALEPGERDLLSTELQRLRHLDDLGSALASAAGLVNPQEGVGALELAGRAAEAIADVERFDTTLAPLAGDLRDAAMRLQEAAIDVRTRLDDLEADPGALERAEARLQLFAELERRFGAPVEELHERAGRARDALDRLAEGEQRLGALRARLDETQTAADVAAARLSKARRVAAARFARDVERELSDLGMERARLDVRLERCELGPRGAETVTLLLAANPGLDAQPLALVASGGELSRIALAVRSAARSGGGPGTLLLDEVDAGVGGRTARVVGEKLRRLSGSAQLLCITHLPQIAGVADRHFRVEKSSGDPTVAEVVPLAEGDVLDELTRMLGADENDRAARETAAALRGA